MEEAGVVLYEMSVFNKNKSCIEILQQTSVPYSGNLFNKNKSCIEMKISVIR